MASALVAGLLLLVNGIAIGGAQRISRRRDRSGALASSGRDDVRRAAGAAARWPHLVLNAVVLLLLGGAIAAPAVAQRIVARPRGTLSTIAIAAPPEVDDGTIVADQGTGHAVVLLRSNYFVVNSDHQSVSMLDARSGRVLHTIRVGSHPSALAVDDRMQRVFVANAGSNSVSVLDARTGRNLGSFPVGVAPIAIAIDSRLGHAFVYNVASATVSVIGTRTRHP